MSTFCWAVTLSIIIIVIVKIIKAGGLSEGAGFH